MSHNHGGQPSTSAYLSGCRDGRCIAQHNAWLATKPTPQQAKPPVVTVPAAPAPEPAPVQSMSLHTPMIPFVPFPDPQPVPEPEPEVRLTAEFDARTPIGGRHVFEAISAIRSTRHA